MRGCDRCDGGWVQVKEGYVDRLAPLPDVLPPELAGDPGAVAAHDALVGEIMRRRAVHARAVYPCKVCLPEQFFRWAGGHYDFAHDRVSCDLCSELDARNRGRSRSRPSRDLVRDGPSPVGETLPPLDRSDLF